MAAQPLEESPSVVIDMSSNTQEEFKYPWSVVRGEVILAIGTKKSIYRAYMYKKWRDTEEQLRQSEKWFRYWRNCDSLVRSCYRIFIAICMISSTVVSTVAGATAMPTLSFVAAGLAAIGSLQEPLEKLFITEFTTRKRKKYQAQCRIRRKYLDKMFIFYLEASKDNVISTDELKHFVDLTYQMDEELTTASMEQQDLLSHLLETQNKEPAKPSEQKSVPSSLKPANETTPLFQESQIDGK